MPLFLAPSLFHFHRLGCFVFKSDWNPSLHRASECARRLKIGFMIISGSRRWQSPIEALILSKRALDCRRFKVFQLNKRNSYSNIFMRQFKLKENWMVAMMATATAMMTLLRDTIRIDVMVFLFGWYVWAFTSLFHWNLHCIQFCVKRFRCYIKWLHLTNAYDIPGSMQNICEWTCHANSFSLPIQRMDRPAVCVAQHKIEYKSL